MCTLRHNHVHLYVHYSLITLSLYKVKSEIFKVFLSKPTILLTVRCVPYWQGFSTIRTVRYCGFRATSPSEHWLLLRNRRRQVAKAVNCVPGLILQNIMKQQLSVCDNILQIVQEWIPYVFLQLNAFGHNAKLPDKKHARLSVFTLTFPITFIDQPGRDRKILQHRYRAWGKVKHYLANTNYMKRNNT